MLTFVRQLPLRCGRGAATLQLQRAPSVKYSARNFAESSQSESGNSSGGSRQWKRFAAAAVAVGVGAGVAYCLGRQLSGESLLPTTLCEKQGRRGGGKDIAVNKKLVYIKGQRNTLNDAVEKARETVYALKDEVGTPGIVVGVSIDGEEVWKEGFGYSDVENRVPCTPNTVMRIASISKPITVAALAKLWEDSKVDLDKPVQEYVPSFPEKFVDEEKVAITPRHLVSHLSGIRHYKKKESNDKNNKSTGEKGNEAKKNSEGKTESVTDAAYEEMYIKDRFEKVEDALVLFKDEPLMHKPGSKYLYTTHGFTLLSAVIEAASKVSFTNYMRQTFATLGLVNTYLDENEPIIYHRSRYYQQKNNRLFNARYVDNSYKWAGGGFLSNVGDLLRFGNAMLYSYQYTSDAAGKNERSADDAVILKVNSEDKPDGKKTDFKGQKRPGFLKRETVEMLWTPVVAIPNKVASQANSSNWYGMGWGIGPEQYACEFCNHQQFYITHSGGAIGASSVLVIVPRRDINVHDSTSLPQGVVVTIITNLTSVGLGKAALKIAQLFKDIDQ